MGTRDDRLEHLERLAPRRQGPLLVDLVPYPDPLWDEFVLLDDPATNDEERRQAARRAHSRLKALGIRL